MAVPVDKVTIDTTVSFSKDAACKIHISYAFLKGNEYAATNDSLLRMGTLQPNYFAASYERLTPQRVIPELARRYGKEYIELARWLKDREHEASRLDWALNIDTRILPSKGDNVVYISDITIKTGETATSYSLCFNIDPKTGKRLTLKDAFGDDYNETLTKKIIAQMAKNHDWDDDDAAQAQSKGYFVGIEPYPSANFILHEDSVTFVYSAGEINPKEVRVTIDN
ncbi:hypothetical protein JCM15124A_02170 [Prevotella falsenii]